MKELNFIKLTHLRYGNVESFKEFEVFRSCIYINAEAIARIVPCEHKDFGKCTIIFEIGGNCGLYVLESAESILEKIKGVQIRYDESN